MSNHIIEWLNAYLDGELHGNRLQQVEIHLAECEICLAELKSLEELSGLLQEVPAPQFSPAERFAAQVSLRLPHPKRVIPAKKVLEIGWWMIPVGLVGIWVLLSAIFFVYDMVSVADRFGLRTDLSGWLWFRPSDPAAWTAALGRVGILSENTLGLLAPIEAFTRTSLPQIILQTSIALLYLSWIAIWWARRQRLENSPLLEGY